MLHYFIIMVNAVTAVNPFIGTKGTGHTFPGAVLPFGLIQLSPDCGQHGWKYCSGYQHGCDITRVSHIHLSGTGAGDGLDIGFTFDKFIPTIEHAEPGYYSAIGPNNKKLEITVSERCGLVKFENLELKLNLQETFNWDTHVASEANVNDTYTSGFRESRGWSNNIVYYNSSLVGNLLTTCISHEKVPDCEIHDFNSTRASAKTIWDMYLSRIQSNNTMLTTALYHVLIHPSKFTEVQPYTIFSTWDTYRAWNTLITWLYPEFVLNFTKSMTVGKYMPIWEIWGKDTHMMTGTHGMSMIGEYVLKGLIPHEMVWDKMMKTLTRDDRYYSEYYANGYIDKEVSKIATSMTLEHAYTDWVLSEIAKKFDLKADKPLQPGAYKNVFSDDMFYNRLKSGEFDKKLKDRVNNGFEEGSAWSYQWSVLHDFKGLIELHNGDEPSCHETLPCTQPIHGKVLERLDEWFSTPGICGQMQDLTDCIGQYAQSNEPNHHVIYLYSVLGHPDRACKYLRQASQFFSDKPEGIPGNDDAGQTSAWLIFAALGFYPVNPASGIYILACPVFNDQLTVGNLTVTVEGSGLRPTHYLNGVELSRLYITHEEVLKGGLLHTVLA